MRLPTIVFLILFLTGNMPLLPVGLSGWIGMAALLFIWYIISLVEPELKKQKEEAQKYRALRESSEEAEKDKAEWEERIRLL